MTLQQVTYPLEETLCVTVQQATYPLEGTPCMTLQQDVNWNAEVIRFLRSHGLNQHCFQNGKSSCTKWTTEHFVLIGPESLVA